MEAAVITAVSVFIFSLSIEITLLQPDAWKFRFCEIAGAIQGRGVDPEMLKNPLFYVGF